MRDSDDLLTLREAADLKGVTKARVQQWIAAGRLRKVMKYGRALVSRRELMALKPLAVGRPRKKKAGTSA